MNNGNNIESINDVTDLGQDYKISGDEMLFCCPYCKSVRGREDKDYKLYFSQSRNTGYCFKCQTVVVCKNYDIDNALKIRVNKPDLYKIYEKQNLLITPWTEDIENNPAVLKYCLDRGFSLETLKKYNIRAYKNSVVLPDTIQDKSTKFFQFRNLEGKIRYTTPRQTEKPIVWLDYVVGDKLLICEGMFSALAASQILGIDAVALIGKTLTELQLKILRKFCLKHKISEFICLLDGGYERENKMLAKSINSNLSGKVSIVSMPQDKDPNDLLKEDKQVLIDLFERRYTL
jgi:hypothetical protein